jgi:hypothetical protein
MADRTRIYKPTDWQIWTYVPEPGSFVLDFSQLNGPHVLGTVGGSLEILDAEIGSLSIVDGGEVSQGFLSELSPTQMQATLSIKDFTAADANSFFLGTDVVVTYKNESDINDAVYGYNTPVFIGRLRSFQVQVMPNADFSEISLSASSKTEDDVNILMGIQKNTIENKENLISDAAALLGVSITTPGSLYNFSNSKYEVKTIGEWFTDLQLGNMNVVCDLLSRNSGTGVWNKFIFGLPAQIDTPEYVFDESSISDVIFDWSGAGAPTGVSLTNSGIADLVYQFGITNQESNGIFNYSATLDLKNITQMTEVGQKMISMHKAFRPVSITTLTAYTNQEITFSDLNSHLYPSNLVDITRTISIDLPSKGFDEVPMIVTGRTLEITPDTWITTYNLWKGFTN